MGALLLTDLAIRAQDLHAMYTDEGMFSRAEICRRATSLWNWSFHFGSGTWEYQAILFGVAGLLALALLVGFETRLSTVGSWLLLVSIQHRVPPILSGAEILMRMLLFWAMFLPLERAWSVDRWRRGTGGVRNPIPNDCEPVLSVASAAILLQIGLMYLFSAIPKTNAQWLHGDALGGILAHDFYALPPAALFLRFPVLLKFMTWGTLLLECAAPVLLFFPRGSAGVRLALIAALAMMHLGIDICLEVGLFSYVSLAGLALFLPSEFWSSRLLGRLMRSSAMEARRAQTGQRFSRKPHRLFYVTQGLCLIALVYLLAVSLNSLPAHPLAPLAPEKWRLFNRGLGLSQSWGMFAAVPSNNGWYVARAKLRDGSEVDLLRQGAPLDWNRPEFPARGYRNHFWHKLFREMSYFDEQGFQVFRPPVAEYLCRTWSAAHPQEKQVAEFEFVFCTADAANAKNASMAQVRRKQLIRLDFLSQYERPAVSGFSDANQASLGAQAR
jgi:hypothetical protein